MSHQEQDSVSALQAILFVYGEPLEIKKIASVKNKRVWSVEYPISAMFNYHGEPLNFKESSGYKQDLVGTAKIDNLRLSEKLLDEVFLFPQVFL